MGGTQFNGLALVHELVRTGHDVTILNRGQSRKQVPRSVRRLYADRTDHEALRKALEGEEFDCVHDISAYRPEDVKAMTSILHGRTGHYVFASSTVIYAASHLLPITEHHPVDRSERQNEYGLNKLLCEDHLIREHRERGFPASIVAFSMVFGPHNIIPDREQRMFVRLARGRKALLPGDGTTLGQVGFVEDEARMQRLWDRALGYGRRALCVEMPQPCQALDRPFDEFSASLVTLGPEDVPTLYGFGVAWAGWVQANAGDWRAVAQIPKLEVLMQRVVELDASYDHGSAHVYLGVLFTQRPASLGGQPERGREHFEQALAIAERRNLMTQVLYARHYARLVFDRPLHDSLLREVMDADPQAPGLTLANTLAREQARRLLDAADDYF